MEPSPPRIALAWNAPAECPSADDVARDALELVGPAAPSRAVRFEVEVVRPTPTVWRAQIDVVSDAGRERQTFEGESCQATAQAAALLIALALNPSATSEPAKAASAPVADAAAPPVAVAAPAVAPGEPSRSDASDRRAPPAAIRPLSLAVRASPRFDASTLPRPTLGAELAIAGRYRGVILEAAGTYWAAEGAALAGAPSVSGNYAMLTGTLRGCYELALGSLALGPCLGGEIDRASAAGSGNIVSASGATAWGAAAPGARASWRLTRWLSATGLAEASIPLVRPHFIVDGSSALYHVPVASLRASLGLELQIL